MLFNWLNTYINVDEWQIIDQKYWWYLVPNQLDIWMAFEIDILGESCPRSRESQGFHCLLKSRRNFALCRGREGLPRPKAAAEWHHRLPTESSRRLSLRRVRERRALASALLEVGTRPKAWWEFSSRPFSPLDRLLKTENYKKVKFPSHVAWMQAFWFAGNFAGDEILAVNGSVLHGLSHSEAIFIFKKIRLGPVVMQIARRGWVLSDSSDPKTIEEDKASQHSDSEK